MPASLHLRCLGSPVVVTLTGEPIRFRTRKHLALLIRLALEPGRRFTRAYLVELLWPRAPARLASHSLAQAISVLKAKLGREHLLIQRATVALAQGAVDCDALRLEGCDAEIRGPFLEGFEITDSRPFEDWKDEWRARLLPRVRDCLVKQMDGGRRIGDFPSVERHAQVLYDLDPLAEDAVRGVMEARAWAGDRTNALKAFARFQDRLADELGARPSADLVRMAGLLRDGGRRPAPRVPVPGPGRAEKRFEAEVLIGREKEFAALYDAWLEVRRRTPRIVVVTADPGVGKTTLANAFVSSCQMEGAVVARAQAYDAERELPFAVLGELVRQLTIQRAIGSADPEALSELSRVTADIFAAFPGVPKPVEWAAEVTPLRLADAFLKAVTAAAEESPVVLVVDDIHAADNASAAILHMVARKITATRVLLILAGRSAELRSSAAPAALTSDAAIDGLRAIELDPLPLETATQLVARLASEAVAERGQPPAERILHASRGNPLALELLTREWATHGPESLLRDLEALDTLPVPALGIPRAIKTVFDRQAQRLDPGTRAVLDLAAVLGRRLADPTLYEAVNLTAGQAAEGLSRLREEGLLREVHGDLEFRNELIRAQAYYAVAGPARQHLHRRVGELLAEQVSHDAGHAKLEIAWHLLRGDRPAQAIPLAIEGSEDALKVGAPREAELMMTVLLTHYSAAVPKNRVELLLAKALLDQSKAEMGVSLLERLLGSDSLSPTEYADAARMYAAAEYLLNRETGLRQYRAADLAVRAATRTGDHELVARALFEYARSGAELGDEDRVRQAQLKLAELREGSRDSRPFVCYAAAYCHYFFNEVREAADSMEVAIEGLRGSTNLRDLSLAYTGYGVCLNALCLVEKAREAFTTGLDLARRLGDDSRASLIACNLSVACRYIGDNEEAFRLAEASLRLGIEALSQPMLVASYNNLAELYVLAGEEKKALECVEKARAWVQGARSWRTNMDFLCTSVSVALMTGNVASGLDLIATAEELARDRERAVPDGGGFATYRVFRAANVRGHDAALEIARDAKTRFENRHLLYYLDAVAALAWLQRRGSGAYSLETQRELTLYEKWGVPGKRTLTAAQGFLD